MSVEQDGFDFGQERIVAVDVRPARLHHADLRIGEVMDRPQQKIFGGTKSASKIAMNSPFAVFMPSSSAPALNPSRFVRWW